LQQKHIIKKKNFQLKYGDLISKEKLIKYIIEREKKNNK